MHPASEKSDTKISKKLVPRSGPFRDDLAAECTLVRKYNEKRGSKVVVDFGSNIFSTPGTGKSVRAVLKFSSNMVPKNRTTNDTNP